MLNPTVAKAVEQIGMETPIFYQPIEIGTLHLNYWIESSIEAAFKQYQDDVFSKGQLFAALVVIGGMASGLLMASIKEEDIQ